MGDRKCIFCGNKGDLSNEHIFPQWLLQEFNISKSKLHMVHNNFGVNLSERKLTFNNFVNGLVCKTCNNGWMSQLEDRVKTTLISLMNFELESIEMLKKNHKDIAKWAIKTAMVLNYGTNYRKIIPRRHLRLFYNGIIPATLFVNISFITNIDKEESDFSWIQSQDLLHIGSDTQRMIKDVRFKDMYRISMRFRHLLIKVLYTPFFNYRFYGDDGDIEIFPYFAIYRDDKGDNKRSFGYKDLISFDVSGVLKEYGGLSNLRGGE
jgi:hypothetical protein